jgi:hypothetical protein
VAVGDRFDIWRQRRRRLTPSNARAREHRRVVSDDWASPRSRARRRSNWWLSHLSNEGGWSAGAPCWRRPAAAGSGRGDAAFRAQILAGPEAGDRTTMGGATACITRSAPSCIRTGAQVVGVEPGRFGAEEWSYWSRSGTNDGKSNTVLRLRNTDCLEHRPFLEYCDRKRITEPG